MSVRGFNTGSGVEQYDYDYLDNKPSINDVTLGGNKTSEELGLLTENDLAEAIDLVEEDLDTKAPVVTKTNGADFLDGADMPMKSLVVNIEPVQAGTGDPSPTNIRPITGWTGLNGSVVGKNWLPNNLTFTDGLRDDTGAQTSSAVSHYSEPFPIKPNTTYTASGVIRVHPTNPRIYFLDKNKNWISRTEQYSVGVFTFTTPENCYYIQVQCSREVDLTAGMISPDQSAAVTPYNGNTFSVSWESEAGTVYSGTVDPIKGTLTVDRAIFDLGTLTWNYDSNLQRFNCNNISGMLTARQRTQKIISDIYRTISDGSAFNIDLTGVIYNNDNVPSIVVQDHRYTDAATFKTAMSGHYVLLFLAVPIVYTLTPTEIRSLLGENHVTVDAGSIESLVYCVDTAAIIERIDADLDGKADQSDLDNLSGTVSNLNRQISESITPAIEEIETALDTKAPAIYETASGDIASFADGADGMPVKSLIANIEPVQDLHGYDYPWPAGGGVNICDPLLKFTAGTYFGMTLSTNDGYQFALSGTATESGNIQCPSIPVADAVVYPAGTYTSKGAIFSTYKPDGSLYTNRQEGTWTADSDFIIRSAYIQIVAGMVYPSTQRFLSLTKGSTALTAWSPYSNICPISGHTGLTVYQTGKNRFDYNYWYDNAQSVSGSSVSRTAITLEPNTVYTVSSNAAQTSRTSKVFAWSGGITDGSPATATTGIGDLYTRQITTDADGQLTVGMYLDSSNPSYIPRSEFEDGTIWIQIEKGSTKTDYEPYAGDQIEVTFPTEAGTVYRGTIDVISGKLTVDKAIVDLGSLTWTKSSNRAFMYSNGIADVVAPPSSQNVAIDGLCTTLPCLGSGPVGQDNQGVGVHTNGNIGVYYDGIPSDANEFKTAVSGWMFLYPLATPIEYQLTGQQMNTLFGYNNIYSDVGSIANIDYPVDTKLYIDNLFASIPTASGVSF